MKRLATAALIIVGSLAASVSTAGASTIRTINFEATNLVSVSGDPFGVYGLGISAPATVSGSFSFDTMASPISGPTNYYIGGGSDTIRYTDTFLRFNSFSVQVGSVNLSGVNSHSIADRIFVRDGVSSGLNHIVGISSGATHSTTLPSGAILGLLQVYMTSDATENPFDGSMVPDVAALNSMDEFSEVLIELQDRHGRWLGVAKYHSLTFTEAVVPIPAGVWLLLSALGGLGLAGWRRKRVVT